MIWGFPFLLLKSNAHFVLKVDDLYILVVDKIQV